MCPLQYPQATPLLSGRSRRNLHHLLRHRARANARLSPRLPYLREAHEHEKPADFDIATVPNQDIEITEEFLEDNQILMAYIAVALFEGALQSNGATDWDVREALDALTAGYRALQTRPLRRDPAREPLCGRHGGSLQETDRVRAGRSEIRRRGDHSATRTILAILAFFQRLEYSRNNGRKKSRAFLDLLSGFYRPLQDGAQTDVEPDDEPRIIL